MKNGKGKHERQKQIAEKGKSKINIEGVRGKYVRRW
jgi:hypothetical protein